MDDFKPKLVCFSCRFGWGYLGDEDELAVQIKNWISVVCSGKIDATHIVEAFQHGADGVLILGCPEGECHYQDGNFEAKKRVYLLQRVLDAYGIEPGRVRMELSHDPEGRSIPDHVKKISEALRKMGPVKAVPVG
jgi:coenzyme F420-reducing hydrogenase delta subunit